MTETDRIRRLYDDRAATLEKSLGIGERLLLGGFRQEYGALLRGEIIEVSVGSGLNFPFYSPAVTRAVGVDLSWEMLQHAGERHCTLESPSLSCRPTPKHSPFRMPASTPSPSRWPSAPFPTRSRRCWSRVGLAAPCRIVMLEHVRSTARPLAAMQRALSPLNERAIGCHLDRDTFGLARSPVSRSTRPESAF